MGSKEARNPRQGEMIFLLFLGRFVLRSCVERRIQHAQNTVETQVGARM